MTGHLSKMAALLSEERKIEDGDGRAAFRSLGSGSRSTRRH